MSTLSRDVDLGQLRGRGRIQMFLGSQEKGPGLFSPGADCLASGYGPHNLAQKGRRLKGSGMRVLPTLPTVRFIHSLIHETALTEHLLYPSGNI